MVQAIEATINEQGEVRLAEAVRFPSVRRALVIVLDDVPLSTDSDTRLISNEAQDEHSRREKVMGELVAETERLGLYR